MAPVEVFFGALLVIFMLIGLVRGFLKELGVATVMTLTLFFLTQFQKPLETGLSKAASVLGAEKGDLILCWVYLATIAIMAFISYEGETLGFGGRVMVGAQRVILGAVMGLFNGYLIAGAIWYYLDRYAYPITWLGFSADKLSATAKSLLPFLPNTFLGQPLFMGQSILLFLSMFLIIARVIR